MIISLSRISQCIEQMLNFDKMDPEGAKYGHMFIDLFKDFKAPVHASSAISDNRIRGEMFIPMDYDRVIDFISNLVNEEAKAYEDIEVPAPPVK
jgi:hypothetical protein